METHDPAIATQARAARYATTMRRIFEEELIGTNSDGQWCIALDGPQNSWRSSWALDTLIDYLATMQAVDPNYIPPTCHGKSFVDFSLGEALDPSSGNWWDDFGWLGVVCLRAAEQLDLSPDNRELLVKKAVNAWCFMYGNGWKKGTKRDDWGKFEVPFPGKAWGKDQISGNVGAPNVFAYAMVPEKDRDLYEKFRPQFGGGVWNALLTGTRPRQSDQYSPTRDYLAPIQNTVTNALYTVLSLRVYKALIDPANAAYFQQSNIDVEAVRTAWETQLGWFNNWFHAAGDAASSLLLDTGNSNALIRERVPRFSNRKWDMAFYSGLAWTGDQGLMLAALSESADFLAKEQRPQQWLTDCYESVLRASHAVLYDDDRKNGLGMQLKPWIHYGAEPAFGTFPEGDDADYQTGVGAFYRYLQQLLERKPALVLPFRDPIFASADRICETDFPNPVDDTAIYTCEALVQQYTDDSDDRVEFNKLTPWINRVALLSIAIRLGKKGVPEHKE